MNTMTMISKKFLKSEIACLEHGVAKVQAGPELICPKCAIALVNSNNANRQDEVNKVVCKKHIEGAMIPERHAKSTLSNYLTKTQRQAHTLQTCVIYTQQIIKNLRGNLIMVGSTGTGKTHLACGVAKTLLKNGLKARYITSEEIANRIMKAWDRDTKDQSEESVIYDLAQYEMLIVDEYGLHDRDKRTELVHKVLTERYDLKKPTMLISNFTLEHLKKDMGDRLWSRFQHDGLTLVECNWDDQRMQGELV